MPKGKVLFVKQLENKNKYFLIERVFKKINLVDYLVCINYDYKTNTYSHGFASSHPSQAYSLFNLLVNDEDEFIRVINS